MALIVIDHLKVAASSEEADHIEYYDDLVYEFLDYRVHLLGPPDYAHELTREYMGSDKVIVYYTPFPLCNDSHNDY